jgi:putative heme-binding domain-containing protein
MVKKAEGDERNPLLDALLSAAADRKLKPIDNGSAIVDMLDGRNANAARLIGLWKVAAARNEVSVGAGNSKLPMEYRRACLEALVDLGEGVDWRRIKEFATKEHPDIRVHAIAAASRTRMKEAADWTYVLLTTPNLVIEEGELKTALNAFLQRKGGVDALNAVLANKSMLPPDRAAMALRIVNASGRDVGKLAATLNKFTGSTGMPAAFSEAERAKLLADVQSFGDPARGEAVYRREAMQCQKCHAIAGAGGLVGADMVSLGASAQLDYIVESLLEPSKKIKEGYHAVNVLKADGASLVGLVVAKSDREIKLRDANGAELTIPTADIEAMKPSTVSLMPQDLFKNLPRNDFLDLAKFLAQLGKDGPYKVGAEKLVRRYRALTATKEASGLLMRVGNQALFEGKPGLTWKPAYSMVNGELPMNELQSLPHFNGEFFAAVRFEIESPAAGKVGLKWNDPANVKLWLGQEEHAVAKEMQLPVAKGINTITLLIDKKRRQTPLKIEVVDIPGGVVGARPVSGL